ncbi:MAG: deoxyribonuclease IV [Syntrophobacteraceae bacterium]
MPYLGAHTSIAGGLHLAFDRMEKVHGQAMQIFTANQRQWRHAGPDDRQIALFKSRRHQCGCPPVAAHGNYLINLAAADERILHQSVQSFSEELKRCKDLGIEFLVTHPGSHGGQGIERGLQKFVKNLDLAIKTSAVGEVRVLLENTAGQGTSLGSSFEEIGYILQNSAYSNTLGICYDTAHGFAAGYDMRDEKTYELTFDSLGNAIGLERLKFFHINDSKREAGSRVDRHEHIGKGKIGLKGFELLLNDPRFKNHPMVLETPKGKDLREDAQNLQLLKSLLRPQGPLEP